MPICEEEKREVREIVRISLPTSPGEPSRRATRSAVAVVTALVGCVLLTSPQSAIAEEDAWVRGDIRLNVRSGPSTEYRILANINTGDALVVLKRGDRWTQVRLSGGTEGWVPEGYLEAQPPPEFDLARLEEEVAQLRRELARSRSESNGLRDSNSSMSSETLAQKSELDDIRVRLARLQAGQGHPEMIAGATILIVGVLIGMMIGRNASRRQSTRIRI
jgi:hypothetical protein